MRHRVDRSGGFTLLEVLVALVVFGILMAGLTQGVQFGLTAWRRQSATIAAGDDIDAVDRTVRRLIEQMDPGTEQERPTVEGNTESLAFTSVLPVAAALPTRRADMRIVLRGHRLTLQWTPHLHAQRLAPPPAAQSTELIDGVKRVVFSYWPRAPGSGWRSTWRDRELPAMVRLHVEFDAQDRHWADIVAVPMRERPED